MKKSLAKKQGPDSFKIPLSMIMQVNLLTVATVDRNYF